jgi:hypothetical protein
MVKSWQECVMCGAGVDKQVRMTRGDTGLLPDAFSDVHDASTMCLHSHTLHSAQHLLAIFSPAIPSRVTNIIHHIVLLSITIK